MTHPLITAGQGAQLLANGAAMPHDGDFDLVPAVKLFTPSRGRTAKERVTQFSRRPRITYDVNDRKRAAAQRWQQRQRDAVPLFAALVAEQQQPVERVMTERVERWNIAQQHDRDRRADQWRKARCTLAAYPEAIRAALLRNWNGHRWLPGDPSYLLDALHRFGTSRLVLDGGAIRPARDVISVREAAAFEDGRKPLARRCLG